MCAKKIGMTSPSRADRAPTRKGGARGCAKQKGSKRTTAGSEDVLADRNGTALANRNGWHWKKMKVLIRTEWRHGSGIAVCDEHFDVKWRRVKTYGEEVRHGDSL